MSSSNDATTQSKDVVIDPSDDVMNMFASVFVKVEVDDEIRLTTNNSSGRSRSRKKQKHPRRIAKTLYCELCEYSTIYKNCLELHILGHNKSKPFACDNCDYTTKYPTSLQRHVLIQHEFKKPDNENLHKELPIHKCDQCTYTTYFKWNLNAHRRKHFLEKQFKCQLCSYATAYRHNYVKHSKVHSKQEVEYYCDKCPFVTKFEGHITRHLAKIHNEVSDKANKCDVCDFSTKVRWRLNIHKQRSKQNNALKCSYCEFETVYMCESKKHKISHYAEIYGNKTFEPNITMYDDSKNNDNSNVDEHNSETKFDDESRAFYTSTYEPQEEYTEKSTHEKNNHYVLDPERELDWNKIQVTESSNKDRPFQCVMCKYTSRFKASVQRHFQRHHTGSQNRPYKCVNCDFSTKTKDQIALHNKRSQSENELCCKFCQFVTYFKCQFVLHQKEHNTHKCTICSYSCKHKYEIQKHFSIAHLGNGLKCRFCDYKATRRESLQCHETIHTGDKPFKCTHCTYMSVRKSLLYNHMKRCHNELLSNEMITIDDSKIESLKVKVIEKDKQSEAMRNCIISTQNTGVEKQMIIKTKIENNPEVLISLQDNYS